MIRGSFDIENPQKPMLYLTKTNYKICHLATPNHHPSYL